MLEVADDHTEDLPHTNDAPLVREVAQAFAPDGALARRLPGYRPRSQQRELAAAVARTLAEGGTLVAEAGTGTGKTYAYLVPALLHGGKILISTGTKPLQDQLFARDLPTVVKALQMPASVALLKGRGNYVCHLHLERTQDDDRALVSRHEVAQLRQIVKFAKTTQTGDRAELASVPETAPIWQRVTSSRDTCLGTECPHYRDCFVVKARKTAQEAEVVVINHALFMADLALKEEGITDLLPAADCVVFDEAHQLPEVATRFLGEAVSTLQLLDLARDALAVGLAQARESADWAELSHDLEHAARELRLYGAHIDTLPGQKCAYEALPERQTFFAVLLAAVEALSRIGGVARALRERHPDLELLARRPPELIARLRRWLPADTTLDDATLQLALEGEQAIDPLSAAPASGEEGAENDAGAADGGADAVANDAGAAGGDAGMAGLAQETTGAEAAHGAAAEVDHEVSHSPEPANSTAGLEWVRWVEFSGTNLRLQSAPLSVAKAFSRARPRGQAWVLTSATLAVRQDFSHFTRQLGLYEAATGRWESPFDYTTHGRLYVPDHLPEPNHPGFLRAFVDDLLPLLEANTGNALILCTTLRAVEGVHGMLAEAFAQQGWTWPLLKQGARSRRELLEFLAHPEPHGAGGQRQLLGRDRCAGRCPDPGGDRQTTVCAARRPRDRCAYPR